MDISDLIQDWGGFEELVAKLHADGSTIVKRNIKLKDRFGTERQIDVLVTQKLGFYEQRIVIECKYWNHNVEREQIDALVTTMQDANASGGAIFTTHGFQSGAIKTARDHGISLFKVRSLSDDEWGRPGRTLDFHLQTLSRAIGPIGFSGVAPRKPASTGLNISLIDGQRTITPLLLSETGEPAGTLEEVIDTTTQERMKIVAAKFNLINSGEDCTSYMHSPLKITFSRPRFVNIGDIPVQIGAIDVGLYLKVVQSHVIIDRGASFDFAVIVEDYLTNARTIAAKRKQHDHTEHTPVMLRTDSVPSEQVLQKGSVLKVSTSWWFDAAETTGLTPIPVVL